MENDKKQFRNKDMTTNKPLPVSCLPKLMIQQKNIPSTPPKN